MSGRGARGESAYLKVWKDICEIYTAGTMVVAKGDSTSDTTTVVASETKEAIVWEWGLLCLMLAAHHPQHAGRILEEVTEMPGRDIWLAVTRAALDGWAEIAERRLYDE